MTLPEIGCIFIHCGSGRETKTDITSWDSPSVLSCQSTFQLQIDDMCNGTHRGKGKTTDSNEIIAHIDTALMRGVAFLFHRSANRRSAASDVTKWCAIRPSSAYFQCLENKRSSTAVTSTL